MCREIECGCGHSGHYVPRGHWHHHWGGCCAPDFGRRRFPTREETIAELEEYLEQLKEEVKGVEEHITELRKSQS